MKRTTATLTLLTLFIASVLLCRADVIILLAQAPPAVQKSILKQAGSGKVLRVEKADENGQIQHKVLTEKKNGDRIEFILKEDGTLDSTEEPISPGRLAVSIYRHVKTTVDGGKLASVKRVTRNGIVTDEVGCQSSADEQSEAVLSSAGKLRLNGLDAN